MDSTRNLVQLGVVADQPNDGMDVVGLPVIDSDESNADAEIAEGEILGERENNARGQYGESIYDYKI